MSHGSDKDAEEGQSGDPPPVRDSRPRADVDPEQAASDRRAQRKMYRIMGSYSTIGLEFGVGLIIGHFLGKYLDGLLGTSPWLMIVCMVLGFLVGWVDLYRLVKKTNLDRMDDPE